MRCHTHVEVVRTREVRGGGEVEEYHDMTVEADVHWPEGEDPTFSNHSVHCHTCEANAEKQCSWWSLTSYEQTHAEDLLCEAHEGKAERTEHRMAELCRAAKTLAPKAGLRLVKGRVS